MDFMSFDDWSNLRQDFIHSAGYIGNTFGIKAFGDASAPDDSEMTLDDYIQLNNGLVDVMEPTIIIDAPLSEIPVLLGSSLTVSLSATDDV